jgi:uncharacterized membrane protein YdjX (TVP38/TMEM64 family)
MEALRRHGTRLGILAVLLAAVALGIGAHRVLDISWSVASLRALVARMGLWGPAGFVLLIGLRTPLLLPSQLVLTAAGLCFGTVQGTVVGALGLLLSASLAFGLARGLGADAVRARVPARLHRVLDGAGSRAGAGLLALGTGYPFGPTTAYHAAAALAGIRYRVFLVAVGMGSAVRAWTFAYFGSSLAEAHWTGVAIATGLIAGAFLPLLHPPVRAWLGAQLGFGPRGAAQGGADIGR